MSIYRKKVKTINMLKFEFERKEEQDHINMIDKKGLWRWLK